MDSQMSEKGSARRNSHPPETSDIQGVQNEWGENFGADAHFAEIAGQADEEEVK